MHAFSGYPTALQGGQWVLRGPTTKLLSCSPRTGTAQACLLFHAVHQRSLRTPAGFARIEAGLVFDNFPGGAGSRPLPLWDGRQVFKPTHISPEYMTLFHSEEYIDFLKSVTPETQVGSLDHFASPSRVHLRSKHDNTTHVCSCCVPEISAATTKDFQRRPPMQATQHLL